MSTFKKMLLLSQEEVERIKAKQIKEYDPALHALARLQDQLDTVLNDPLMSQLHPDERLKLFQRLQHRFNEIKHDGDAPIKLAGVSATLPEPEPAAPAAPPDFPQIPGVNVRYRTHAKHLMKHLFHDPSTFTVNDRNELVIKGQAVPGSNFVDLLSDVFATSKSRVEGPRPAGYPEFLSALRDVNAPRTLLINPKYSSSLHGPAVLPLSPQPMHRPAKLKKGALAIRKLHSSHLPHVLSLYNV